MALTKISHDDNDKAVFGTSEDLQIYHSGTNTFIANSTGPLKIRSDTLELGAANGEQMLQGTANGPVNLYHDGIKKFETSSGGVTVTGNIYTDGNVNLTADNKKIRFGAGEDLQLYFDGTHSRLVHTPGTGDLVIQSDDLYLTNGAGGEYYLRGTANGAVELYHNNVKKFETTSAGATFTGKLSALDGSGSAGSWIALGDSDDLKIYHSGTQSEIINSGGDLLIQCTGDDLNLKAEDDVNIKVQGGVENAIIAYGNAAVELYYDNSKKLETTSSGVVCWGDFRASGAIDMEDSEKIKLGTGDDLQIYHDGSQSWIKETGSAGQFIIDGYNGTDIRHGATAEHMIRAIGNAQVELYYDNSKKFETVSTGCELPDNSKLYLGDGGDLALHHDGSNSYIANTTGELFISASQVNIKSAAGEYMAYFNDNGEAALYYDDSKKFETTSTGAKITSNGSSNGLTIVHSNGNTVADLSHNGSGDEGVFQLKDSNSTQIQLNAEIGQKSFYTAGSFIFGNAGATVTTGQRGIEFQAGASGNPVFIKTSSGHYSSGAYTHWQFYDDHGNVGWVNADGDGTASYNTASDYRLKENAVAITDGIEKVKQLKPYRFNYKTAETSQVVQGFFAHEVSTVVPNAVDGAKDAVAAEDSENTGHKKGDPIYQGLDQAKMVPILTAALQEAITKIETLETKVAALEAG